MKDAKRNVVFFFFDAEERSRAGSSRLLKDLTSGVQQCRNSNLDSSACFVDSNTACRIPCFYQQDFGFISPDSISLSIEFKLTGSVDPSSNSSVSYFYKKLSDTGSTVFDSFNSPVIADPFNSSSAVTIPFKEATAQQRVSAIADFAISKKKTVVSFQDFESTISNPFYNSEFDLGESWNAINTQYLCGLVTRVTQITWAHANDVALTAVPASVQGNCSFVRF